MKTLLLLLATCTCFSAAAQALDYGYTGRERDEGGLVYFRARYYDPALGRFTQRDPIGLMGGLNDYRYGDADPVGKTDSRGTVAEPKPGPVVAKPCYWDCAQAMPAAGLSSVRSVADRGDSDAQSQAFAQIFESMVRIVKSAPAGPIMDVRGGQLEMMVDLIDDILAYPLERRLKATMDRHQPAPAPIVPPVVAKTIGTELIPWVEGIDIGQLSTPEERWAAMVLRKGIDIYQKYGLLPLAGTIAANIRANDYREKFNAQKDWRVRPKNFGVK